MKLSGKETKLITEGFGIVDDVLDFVFKFVEMGLIKCVFILKDIVKLMSEIRNINRENIFRDSRSWFAKMSKFFMC